MFIVEIYELKKNQYLVYRVSIILENLEYDGVTNVRLLEEQRLYFSLLNQKMDYNFINFSKICNTYF